MLTKHLLIFSAIVCLLLQINLANPPNTPIKTQKQDRLLLESYNDPVHLKKYIGYSLASSRVDGLESPNLVYTAPKKARYLSAAKPKDKFVCPLESDDFKSTIMKKDDKGKFPPIPVKDFLTELNNCRVDPKTCHDTCKSIISDPLKKDKKNDDTEHCRWDDFMIPNGIKQAKKLLEFLVVKKNDYDNKKYLKPLIFDPCQSIQENKHAQYMSDAECLTHYELADEKGKAIDGKLDKCNGVMANGATKKIKFEDRATVNGVFDKGSESIGVIDARYVNPKSFVCIVLFDINNDKSTNRKNLFNADWEFIGLGMHIKATNLYYGISYMKNSGCPNKEKLIKDPKLLA